MNLFELTPDSKAVIEKLIVDAVRETVQQVLPVIVKAELELAKQLAAKAANLPPPK